MLRYSELPFASELPALDEEPAVFNPSPEWFIPGVKPSLRELEDVEDDEGLGFRSLIEDPRALSKAWRATDGERVRRHRGRSRSSSRAV